MSGFEEEILSGKELPLQGFVMWSELKERANLPESFTKRKGLEKKQYSRRSFIKKASINDIGIRLEAELCQDIDNYFPLNSFFHAYGLKKNESTLKSIADSDVLVEKDGVEFIVFNEDIVEALKQPNTVITGLHLKEEDTESYERIYTLTSTLALASYSY